jgi:hypothetical protein
MRNNQDREISCPESQVALNRLLEIEQFSLANYLLNARPWTHPGDEPLLDTVRRIAEDQRNQAIRIGQLLVDRNGYIERNQFPMEFVDYNDLALDYLMQRVIEDQQQLINEVAAGREQLADDPEARQLADEILANEKQHLEMLTRVTIPVEQGASTVALAPQAT